MFIDDVAEDNRLKDDFLAPEIKTETGLELIDAPEGWVIGARGEKLLRFTTDKHMITIANTGGGKGTSVAIPNLLTHGGSIFSIEIGGSTLEHTWPTRKNAMGQKIYVIDPFGVTAHETAHINLLETLVPNSPEFLTEVSLFAQSMLKSGTGAKETNPFWEKMPALLLKSLLVHVRTSPDVTEEDRNLIYVAKLLGKRDTHIWKELMNSFADDVGPYHMVLNAAGNEMKGEDNITKSNIISSVTNCFESFRDPTMAKISQKSSFTLEDLRKNKISVYVVMRDASGYQAHATWLRLLVERAFAACPASRDAGKSFKQNDRVLFMLDEFTQLGKLEAVDVGMQTARQKGVTIWAMFQDLGRLQETYGERIASSFLGAAGVVQVFDAGDQYTPEYVSKRLGRGLVHIPSVQYGWNGGANNQENWSATQTTGLSKGVMESFTEGDTEQWSEAFTDTVSQSRSHTVNTGTSSSENSDGPPRGILGMPRFGFKGAPSVIDQLRSTRRTYGTVSNDGTSESSSNGESHAKTSQRGGSHNTGRTQGTNETTSESEANMQGGSKGTSSGWQYNLTISSQIAPKLDPSEIETILGTNGNQILFVRASNKVMRLLERRAYFWEIPRLDRLVKGDFAILPPTMPYRRLKALEEPSILLSRIGAMNFTYVKKDDYKIVSYAVTPPLRSYKRSGKDPESRSPGEYRNALSDFQKAVKNGEKSRALVAQEKLYETVIKAVAAIDEEAKRLLEEPGKVVKIAAAEKKYQEDIKKGLEAQARILKNYQGELKTAAEILQEAHSRIESRKKELLSYLFEAKSYDSLGGEYRHYLKIVRNISSLWKGIRVPKRITTINEPSPESLMPSSEVEKHLRSQSALPSRSTEEVKLPAIDLKFEPEFDFSSLNVDPGIEKKMQALRATFGGRSLKVPALQGMIEKKEKEPPSRLRRIFDMSGFSPQSLKAMRHARNEAMRKFMSGINSYYKSNVKGQENFAEWLDRSNTLRKNNIEILSRFNETLGNEYRRLAVAENNILHVYDALKEDVKKLEKMDAIVRKICADAHNRIALAPEWDEMQRNGALLTGSTYDNPSSAEKEKTSGSYTSVDPYMDAPYNRPFGEP